MTRMKELYEKVANDSALQAKFYEIIKNADKAGEKETVEKLISFAKDAGYDVTLDEVKDFFSKLAEQAQGGLSETELDMVAGGKSDNGVAGIIVSICTLGTACAAVSLLEEIRESGACKRVFD